MPASYVHRIACSAVGKNAVLPGDIVSVSRFHSGNRRKNHETVKTDENLLVLCVWIHFLGK